MIFILAVPIIFVLIIIGMYNSMVKLRNNRENAFADIDVQLQQRHDLIPQLVETVRGYTKHESNTLLAVVEARNGAVQARSIDDKIVAESKLTSALQGLKVTFEQYPDLKASKNFMQLQEEISDIENKLSASRRFFNSATKEYNNSIQTFPANIIAGMFNFQKEIFFFFFFYSATVSSSPIILF
jgi:LemA protein